MSCAFASVSHYYNMFGLDSSSHYYEVSVAARWIQRNRGSVAARG